ncbi:MAG: MFS transporter [Bacteroidales bacterium]|nr:MFS transporter [Bacteroidales bacterium]
MVPLNLRQKRNLYLILSVTLLSLAGVPSIIPILAEISEELNISESKIGLLITVFTLPGALLAPFLGMIIDRWGRKKVLLVALVLFGVCGTACFFLRSFDMILVLRFFQGMGAACLGIVNITLIGDIYGGNQKVRVMGYNSGVMSVSMALFPAAGGLLASISWYYPFLIPALALVVALLVYFYLDNPEPVTKPGLTSYLNHVLKTVLNRRAVMLFVLSFATFIGKPNTRQKFFCFCLFLKDQDD